MPDEYHGHLVAYIAYIKHIKVVKSINLIHIDLYLSKANTQVPDNHYWILL